MNRFLIVDGSNLLFQMFFGMPARIVNKQGKAIHGTLGFVGALLKIIRRIEPTYMVVLFDGEHENARSELNVDYKANRVDYSQIPEEENPFHSCRMCILHLIIWALNMQKPKLVKRMIGLQAMR